MWLMSPVMQTLRQAARSSDNLGVWGVVNKHSESTGLHVELFLGHVTGQEWMCVKVIAMWKERHRSGFRESWVNLASCATLGKLSASLNLHLLENGDDRVRCRSTVRAEQDDRAKSCPQSGSTAGRHWGTH